MRLLDRVAQCSTVLAWRPVGAAGPARLAGAGDWAPAVRACPIRWVLTDPLTSLCTALAYADGDRLHGCLDLVRVPAERLWIEWNDAARAAALPAGTSDLDEPHAGPAGALVHARPDGRAGCVHTFWAAGTDGPPHVAAMETVFDLDEPRATPGAGWLQVTDGVDPALAAVYAHVRFRLEPSWAAYYAAAGLDADTHAAVVRRCLATVARDLPMLFALFLLTTARDVIRRQPVVRTNVNALRGRSGAPALLDHVEVHASPFGDAAARSTAGPADVRRRGPRLHHVRGHLVRRHDRVFWRVPHLRGNAAAGIVRSRTVTLEFAPRR